MPFVNMIAEKAPEIVMAVADFTPIQALIASLFGIVIMMAVLKKFNKGI